MFSDARRRHPRGFTLIELMTAAAVGAVLVAAAFAVFGTMNTVQANTERKISAAVELTVGTQRQFRTVENTGMNFKSSRIAFQRVHGLNQLCYHDAAGAPQCLNAVPRGSNPDAGVDPAGFFIESGIIEAWEGFDPITRPAGTVLTVVSTVGSYDGTVTLSPHPTPALGAPTGALPMTPSDKVVLTTDTLATLSAADPTTPRYLLFSGPGTLNGNGTTCLMRVSAYTPSTPPSVTVAHAEIGFAGGYGPNLFVAAQGPAPAFTGADFANISHTIQGCSPTGLQPCECPAPGQRVYGAFKRRLFAVARMTIGARPALYEFDYNWATDFFDAPIMLSAGVEEMVANPMVACSPDLCEVTDGGADAQAFPYGPAVAPSNQVVGVRLKFISRGVHDGPAPHGQVVLYEDGTSPTDGFAREFRESKIPFVNLNPALVDVD